MKKPQKGKKQQQIGKTQEEHMPQSTPSTAACRSPFCAISSTKNSFSTSHPKNRSKTKIPSPT
jgi:hypothetical protein